MLDRTLGPRMGHLPQLSSFLMDAPCSRANASASTAISSAAVLTVTPGSNPDLSLAGTNVRFVEGATTLGVITRDDDNGTALESYAVYLADD